MFQRCKKLLFSGLVILVARSAFVAVQSSHTTTVYAASTVTIDPTQQYQTIQW